LFYLLSRAVGCGDLGVVLRRYGRALCLLGLQPLRYALGLLRLLGLRKALRLLGLQSLRYALRLLRLVCLKALRQALSRLRTASSIRRAGQTPGCNGRQK
jgi:hypothetical protein